MNGKWVSNHFSIEKTFKETAIYHEDAFKKNQPT